MRSRISYGNAKKENEADLESEVSEAARLGF